MRIPHCAFIAAQQPTKEAIAINKDIPNISESEWRIMIKLWEESPVTAAELVEKIQKEKRLGMTTIKTLLRRLIAKKAVGFTVDEKNAKLYHYYPLVSQKDCIMTENKQFLSLYYGNNLKKMFATFLENAALSAEEIESLKQVLEKKEGKPDE